MQVKISIKDEEIIKHLEKLSPKKLIHGWAEEIVTLAIENAKKKKQEVNGRSFWQREVIGSVHSTEHENHAVVYSDNYIAEHVHTGGIVKPTNHKNLAIPIDKSAKGKRASEWGNQLIFVFRRQKNGPKRTYLALPMKRKVKFLYVLKPQVYQKPRPWWPDDEQIKSTTVRFFNTIANYK